jgi:hypothetical protein
VSAMCGNEPKPKLSTKSRDHRDWPDNPDEPVTRRRARLGQALSTALRAVLGRRFAEAFIAADVATSAGLIVLTMAGDRIQHVTRFHTDDLYPRFGLPIRCGGLPLGDVGEPVVLGEAG